MCLIREARALEACVATPPSEWFKINVVLDTKRRTMCHSKNTLWWRSLASWRAILRVASDDIRKSVAWFIRVV